MTTYLAKFGPTVPHAINQELIDARSPTEALSLAVEWATAVWPNADRGEGIVWVEDSGGCIVASEEVIT